MTIAACCLTLEGVVFGADSTTTFGGPGGLRHYNFAQKIFEIGQPSTLGIVTWGLGGFADRSYRTMIAQFADGLKAGGMLDSIEAVTKKWVAFFWEAYSGACSTY